MNALCALPVTLSRVRAGGTADEAVDATPILVTVTSNEPLRCAWCGEEFERPGMRGPAPKYCCRAHRQRAHEARQKAALEDRLGVLEAGLPATLASLRTVPALLPDYNLLFAAAVPKLPDFTAAFRALDVKVFDHAKLFAAAMPKLPDYAATFKAFDQSKLLAAAMPKFGDDSPALAALGAGVMDNSKLLGAFGVKIPDYSAAFRALDIKIFDASKLFAAAVPTLPDYSALLTILDVQLPAYTQAMAMLDTKLPDYTTLFSSLQAKLGASLLDVAMPDLWSEISSVQSHLFAAFEASLQVAERLEGELQDEGALAVTEIEARPLELFAALLFIAIMSRTVQALAVSTATEAIRSIVLLLDLADVAQQESAAFRGLLVVLGVICGVQMVAGLGHKLGGGDDDSHA